jgi:N-carbamoyl-L-amino-acid hydrolase
MKCDPDLVESLERQAAALGLSFVRMPSGAGHDTQFLSEITRAGLLFVPSVGGVSHSPDEWTHWSDIESGANLLLNAAVTLATKD